MVGGKKFKKLLKTTIICALLSANSSCAILLGEKTSIKLYHESQHFIENNKIGNCITKTEYVCYDNSLNFTLTTNDRVATGSSVWSEYVNSLPDEQRNDKVKTVNNDIWGGLFDKLMVGYGCAVSLKHFCGINDRFHTFYVNGNRELYYHYGEKWGFMTNGSYNDDVFLTLPPLRERN